MSAKEYRPKVQTATEIKTRNNIMGEPMILHFSDCDFVLGAENVQYLPGIYELLDCVNYHDFKDMTYERFRVALVVEKLCSPKGIYTS
jgi:hypothetical protein